MTRTLRAAELSAATVALFAAVSFAAPSLADTGGPLPGQQPAARTGYLAAIYDKGMAALGYDAAMPAAAPVKTLLELVDEHEAPAAADGEQDCLAKAVYFESRGEPIEGQLAVAEVVMNRAASGRYPTGLCDVITQKAQFSFIRNGRFPTPDEASEAWRKAVAIARIASDKLVSTLPADVLWYHADYVAPSWGKRLTRTAQIGLHIFYS
ncbi:MAG TPA: cell wall hydrolase [Allosphingosinicella sp.]|jgi:spore germination cell wall hydrolase CwlJ-like protein